MVGPKWGLAIGGPLEYESQGYQSEREVVGIPISGSSAAIAQLW